MKGANGSCSDGLQAAMRKTGKKVQFRQKRAQAKAGQRRLRRDRTPEAVLKQERAIQEAKNQTHSNPWPPRDSQPVGIPQCSNRPGKLSLRGLGRAIAFECLMQTPICTQHIDLFI